MEERNFTKSNISPWVFFTFFNSKNGTKSGKAHHIRKSGGLIVWVRGSLNMESLHHVRNNSQSL